MKHISLLIFIAVLLSACSTSSSTTSQPVATETAIIASTTPEASMALQLTSDAFVNGQSIPAKYTCTGMGISPALAWTEPPAGTQSFALIVDDPDAPGRTWVHWVLFNISTGTRSLKEGFTAENTIAVGKNSSSHLSYDGPCPPSGTHRYFFKLYALDAPLSLSPGATKDQLLKAMDGHILAQAELMGTFSK